MIIEFWKTNENPITCYHSTIVRKGDKLRIPIKKDKSNRQAVTIISKCGKKQQCESVVAAADAVGMKSNMLYAVLNGKAKNTTEYQFFKSKINN